MNLWRHADYRWWLAGDTAGNVAVSIKVFVIPLLAFSLTGSSILAGSVGSAIAVISLVCSLFGGVVVDRNDRRTVIRVYCVAGMCVCLTIVVLVSTRSLSFGWLLGLSSLWAVCAGLAGNGTDAALRSMVSERDYPSAMATNQGRDAVVGLAAAPMGAVLYAIRASAPFALAFGGYLLLLASTWGIRVDLRPPSYERRSVFGDIASGAAWMWQRPRLRALVLVAALANLGVGGMLYTLQLSLLRSGVEPIYIGYLTTASAIATIVGSLAAGRLVGRFTTGRISASALLWMCLSLVPVAFTDSYGVMMGCLALESLAPPAMISGLLGYLFARTPIHLQGRVQSLVMLFTGIPSAFAPFGAGLLLEVAGYGWAVTTFFVSLVMAAIVAIVSPLIRGIPSPAQWGDCPL